MRRHLRSFAVALFGGLGGCFGGGEPPAETINVSDDKVFQPVVRAAKSIPQPRGAASNPQTGHAIELGFTQASGSSTQSISSGYISLDGSRRINAPASVQYEFDFRYIDVSYRWRQVFGTGSGFGYEALAGAAVADLDFTASAPGQARLSTGMSAAGLALGVGGLWRLRPGTSVQARGSSFFSGDENNVTRATRLDLFLQQALGGYAAVRAGYTWWSLESERGGTTSPINVDLRGPVLGLELMF